MAYNIYLRTLKGGIKYQIMKFKTTIEIVSEASNKEEAKEIAGEYLSGDIVGGIDMKISTARLLNPLKKIVILSISILFLGLGLLTVLNFRQPHNSISGVSGLNAVQPPLRTSANDKTSTNFKDEWEKRQTKEALNRITK